MATKPTATVTVDSLILAAGKAADSMLAKTREAAKLAASELDTSKPLADRIAAVMTAHAEAFKTAGHNVKALFADALTLLACAGDRVVVAGPKGSSQDMAAKDAVNAPKHAMRAAARDVREAHGIGRAKKAAAAAPVVAPKIDREAEFKNVLAELAEVLKNPEHVDRLTQFLAVAGYVLAPKAAVANAPKPATRAPKPTMASLPGTVVKGAAQSAAPF